MKKLRQLSIINQDVRYDISEKLLTIVINISKCLLTHKLCMQTQGLQLAQVGSCLPQPRLYKLRGSPMMKAVLVLSNSLVSVWRELRKGCHFISPMTENLLCVFTVLCYLCCLELLAVHKQFHRPWHHRQGLRQQGA